MDIGFELIDYVLTKTFLELANIHRKSIGNHQSQIDQQPEEPRPQKDSVLETI